MLAAVMIVALAQQPLAGPLRELWTEHGVARDAAAVVQRLGSARAPRSRVAVMPAVGVELARAGAAAVDVAVARTEVGGAGLRERIAALAGLVAVRLPDRRKPLDLASVQHELDHAFRDVRKALGSGRGAEREAPRLVAMLEDLRTRQRIDAIDRADREELLERVERVGSVDGAALTAVALRIAAWAPDLADPELLDELRRQPTRQPQALPGVEGAVLEDRETPFGRLVVGGFGRNVYDCTQVDVVIDLGGDDEYRGPAGGAWGLRRFGVVIDCAGNDRYETLHDGFGAATYGVGVLVDLAGDDSYQAEGRSCGFGAAGCGLFVDAAGADEYRLGHHSAGCAAFGAGFFLDLAGDDRQRAGPLAFGVGLPGGIGVFVDAAGDEERELGTGPPPVSWASGDAGAGFGFGLGVPGLLAGGLGLCVDGGGVDRYQAHAFGLGCGIGGGIGVFRELGGDDVYEGTIGLIGVADSGGFGVFVDHAGDDRYRAGALALGVAFGGVAFGVDCDGHDEYAGEAPALGVGRGGGIGVFVDCGGNDGYRLVAAAAAGVGPATDGRPASVGTFLDDGAAADVYELAGEEMGNGRVELGGNGPGAKRLLVDR